jgi:glycogen debranching enzyme
MEHAPFELPHRGVVARDYEQPEWLLTDGRGGYSLGTRSLLNTRKYHGLLVVALPKPQGRTVLLSRLEEVLVADGQELSLDAACYLGDTMAGFGFDHIEAFEPYPTPTWRFRVGHRLLERTVIRMSDASAVRIQWRLLEGEPAFLLVRPMLTTRKHHHVLLAGEHEPESSADRHNLWWRLSRSHPRVHLRWSGALVEQAPHVYRNHLLLSERDRGYECVEDLFAPVRISFPLMSGETAWIDGRMEAMSWPPFQRVAGEAADPLADPFLFRRADGSVGIIAGYPWFDEWARDSLIAISGLLLQNGRTETALSLLEAWGRRLSSGLFPNQMAEDTVSDLATNSADAPLLFLSALDEWERTAARELPTGLEDTIEHILDAWIKGTGHGIRLLPSGLVVAGLGGEALTWMDAIVDGVPVTPRHGSPIELQALMVSGLRFARAVAKRRGDDARAAALTSLLEAAEVALVTRFLDPTGQELVDRLNPDGHPEVSEVRPNVLFALRLPGIPFARDVAERTLLRVEAELLTPFGLRTLSPHHLAYHGSYGGDQPKRDRAYHQGTVWPWLMGVYGDAVLAVRGDTPSVRADLLAALEPLLHLLDANGQLPELFDGDAPHHSKGCPNQAWSVAEVLRLKARLLT